MNTSSSIPVSSDENQNHRSEHSSINISTSDNSTSNNSTRIVATTETPKWRLRINQFGVFWLIACLIFFLFAANYSNNLLLLLSLIMLTLFVNASWYSWLNIRRLSVTTVKLMPIFAGQSNQITVQISNPDGKKHPGVMLRHRQFNSVMLIPEQAQKQLNASIEITEMKRGCYAFNAIEITSSFPLGLMTWSKSFPSAAKLWVYPQAQGNQTLPKPKVQQGTYLKKEQGDFSHVRSYQRGDSLNHIAWKQMARTGDVMTKEFEGGEGLRQTWLDLNDILHTDNEAKLSQLCRWILSCHQKQLKYGVKLGQQHIDAAQGEGHKENCLQALAQFGQNPTLDGKAKKTNEANKSNIHSSNVISNSLSKKQS